MKHFFKSNNFNYQIFITGCLAEWSAPEDDGGTPITQYIVEKAEGASVNWTVCGKTKGDVTKCRVTGLKTGKDHRLQVNKFLILLIQEI